MEIDCDNNDDGEPPKRFRAVASIYNDTEPIELMSQHVTNKWLRQMSGNKLC